MTAEGFQQLQVENRMALYTALTLLFLIAVLAGIPIIHIVFAGPLLGFCGFSLFSMAISFWYHWQANKLSKILRAVKLDRTQRLENMRDG